MKFSTIFAFKQYALMVLGRNTSTLYLAFTPVYTGDFPFARRQLFSLWRILRCFWRNYVCVCVRSAAVAYIFLCFATIQKSFITFVKAKPGCFFQSFNSSGITTAAIFMHSLNT